MNRTISNFRNKINRQRTAPHIWDFSYINLQNNAKAFQRFSRQVESPARILDAGCGFKPWLDFFPHTIQYIGVDYSSEWSSADGLASVDHLPFSNNTFDAVICSEVIEHTRYPERCIKELIRVCKPDGLIYLSTPFAFPEHGVPYDFQRPTQYFYKSVFSNHQIVELNATSSTLASAFVTFNYFVECTPLRFAWGLRHIFYTITNCLAIFIDIIINFTAPRIMRSLKLYTHMMPLGYNMIIRVKKID